MDETHAKQQRQLVAQWQETGALLEKLRYQALAAQTPEESRQAAYDMLQLGGMLDADKRRERYSGMVEMQRLFGLLRKNGRT
ncbi:MAG: hypothetical protein ACKVQK_16835 [Burkholderiales bacterium]